MSDSRPDIGSLWENWTIAEAAKWNLLAGQNAELFFWRSRSRAEVDLLIRRNGALQAFEMKWGGKKSRDRAFRDAYQIEPELISPANPFIGRLFQ